jgi:putative chitinase
VAKPEVGFRTAGWFWQVNSLNGLADRGDLREITKRVTGNYERLEQRQQYYRKAKEVLGVKD